MTKTTIISISAAVVIIAGLIIWQVAKPDTRDDWGNDIAPEESSLEESAATAPEMGGKKMAFSQFIKQGGSYECTVTQYINGDFEISTQGTAYIANGMIRGEYSTEAQGMDIDASVIVRDGFAYTWTNLAPMGYKVAVTEDVEMNDDGSMSGTYSWNADQIGDYDCVEAEVDADLFELPSQVTFQEIAA